MKLEGRHDGVINAPAFGSTVIKPTNIVLTCFKCSVRNFSKLLFQDGLICLLIS
jgi:hypothetical protein